MSVRISDCLVLANPGCPIWPIIFKADSHMNSLDALRRLRTVSHLGLHSLGGRKYPLPAANFFQPFLR
ncbi:unnamed protein product [Schistocephalus solidus]|uniref:Uncharacterized protein n=1 Tax=Schistocephalus solidus TaxID=70667 RepID=A0A183T3E3_SCHSO|nr:unnamed protein product [Schistocephalus solidus]